MKKYLVIGGSKGVGEACVKIALQDHEVVNISRTVPKVSNDNLEHFKFDVNSDDELPKIQNIDALVYCPGSITLKPISSLKVDDFLDDYKINVIGAVKCIKHYLKALKSNEGGAIILFSSVAVAQGMPFHSSIAAAKAGVEALTKSLAAELAPSIRVNCIAPTITDTELAKSILRNEKSRENLVQKHPLKRIIQPEEIAEMAMFLAGEKASSITGQIIGIDAGLSNLKI